MLPVRAPTMLFEGLPEALLKKKMMQQEMLSNQLKQQESTRQFNERLAETARHNKSMESNQDLRNDLLKAKIESEKAKVKTPEDKLKEKEDLEKYKFNLKEGHEIKSAATQLKSVYDRALKLKKLIVENPKLTGPLKGRLADLGAIDDEKLSAFIETAGKLQGDIARYGSTRGGAQALKWAELIKPSHKKGGKFNLGMINSILENAQNDYSEYANQFEEIEGKPLSVRLSSQEGQEEGVEKQSGKNIKIKNKKTGEVKEISYEEAKSRGYVK